MAGLMLSSSTVVWGQSTTSSDGVQLASSSDQETQVSARLVSDTTSIVPGKPFRLGIELQMKPGWHTYYLQSGEAGMPTSVKWKLPPGFTAGELLWEKPHKFNDSDITTYGYDTRTVVAAV